MVFSTDHYTMYYVYTLLYTFKKYDVIYVHSPAKCPPTSLTPDFPH